MSTYNIYVNYMVVFYVYSRFKFGMIIVGYFGCTDLEIKPPMDENEYQI